MQRNLSSLKSAVVMVKRHPADKATHRRVGGNLAAIDKPKPQLSRWGFFVCIVSRGRYRIAFATLCYISLPSQELESLDRWIGAFQNVFAGMARFY